MTAIKSNLLLALGVIAVISVLVYVAVFGPSSVSPADAYTGEATIQSTDTRKQGCFGNIILEDGQKDRIKLGERNSCEFEDGSKIRLDNGNYIK